MPYQDAVFTLLVGRIVDDPRVVLDAGCGTGNVARPLALINERVEAVDVPAAMIAEGRHLPGGDRPSLRRIVGRTVGAPVESFHSMASFSRERLPPGEADAFDAALPRMVRAHTFGAVEQEVHGAAVWGRPRRP